MKAAAAARQLTPQPLYSQVRQLLVEHIQKGDWMVGDSLPNEALLAKEFGVSVGTIRKAIEGLEDHGLVKRIQGRGTFVAGIGSHVLRQKFTRLRGRDGQPLPLQYELVSVCKAVVDGDVADQTAWGQGLEVCKVEQLLKLHGTVVGLEVSFLRSEKLPKLQSYLSFGQDLYSVLADYGLIVTQVSERLSLSKTDADIACTLGLGDGEVTMRSYRLAYSMDKVPVEFRISHYVINELSYSIEIA